MPQRHTEPPASASEREGVRNGEPKRLIPACCWASGSLLSRHPQFWFVFVDHRQAGR